MNSSIRTHLGDRIRRARRAKGYSIDELAAALDLHRETVRLWEKGKAEPRAERLWDVSRILDVSEAFLLCGSQEGPIALEVDEAIRDLAALLSELDQPQKEAILLIVRSLAS